MHLVKVDLSWFQADAGVVDFTRSLEYLYPKLNIRCCGLATDACQNQYGRTGFVWEHGKHKHVNLTDAVNAVIRCIEDDTLEGGSVLQVVKGKAQPIAFSVPISVNSGNCLFCFFR